MDVTWSNANFFLPINKLICSTIDRERHRKEIARQYQTKNANAVLEEDDGHEDTNRTDPDTMNGNDQDLNAEENRRRMLQKLQVTSISLRVILALNFNSHNVWLVF